jgi:hypothetical protein
MLVEDMIEKLLQANPKAKMEVRGTVEEGYLTESDIAIDICSEDTVVIDI